MPLYETECLSCGRWDEHLLKVGEAVPDCQRCSGKNRLAISTVAFTPGRWGDSHGSYNAGLGCYVENDMHRERICKERGLVMLDDVGSSTADSMLDRRRREDLATDKYIETFDKHKAEGAGFYHAAKAAKEVADGIR